MSHKATYWLATLNPKIITSGSFRVLFHLCDHHNDTKDPKRACFPSQETLIEKTGLSNGGLNKCLDTLETTGLLSRNRSTIPGTSRRRTYFILGCDDIQTTTLTPLSGDSPNSTPVETATEQTPLLDEANSTFDRGKLHPSGEEPVREPVKELCVPKIDTHTHFSEFWKIHPRPKNFHISEDLFFEAVDAGVEPESIVFAAKCYANEQTGNGTQYICGSDSWLKTQRWADFETPKSHSPDEIREIAQKMINSPVSSVRDAGRKMLEAAE